MYAEIIFQIKFQKVLIFLYRFVGRGFTKRFMSPVNMKSFISPFPICLSFISISRHIALTRTSSFRMRRNREQTFLSSHTSQKESIHYFTINLILTVNLSYLPFIMLSIFPLISAGCKFLFMGIEFCHIIFSIN